MQGLTNDNAKLIEILFCQPATSKSSIHKQHILKSSDTHHTIFPVSITDALFFIFKDWKFIIPEKDTANMTELFLKHYNDLSEKVGLEINPPEFDFYLLAYVLNERNQTEEKIKLLERCKNLIQKRLALMHI